MTASISKSLEIASSHLPYDIDFTLRALNNGSKHRNYYSQLLEDAIWDEASGNNGFGAGHNFMMAEAFSSGADYYLALNPDGILHPECLYEMLRYGIQLKGKAIVEALQFPEEHPKTYDPLTLDTEWASGACMLIRNYVNGKLLSRTVPSEAIRGILTSRFIVGFDGAIENTQRDGSKNITDLSDIAKQAGIAALNTLLQKTVPPLQMDFLKEPKSAVHRQLDESATAEGFGDLAQNFFATLAKNNIQYYIDRELPNHLGNNGFSHSIPDMTLFDQSLDRHCKEASFIMRTFARDWNANAFYNQKKTLTQKDVNGFAHIAIDKMRKEFKFRNEANERN